MSKEDIDYIDFPIEQDVHQLLRRCEKLGISAVMIFMDPEEEKIVRQRSTISSKHKGMKGLAEGVRKALYSNVGKPMRKKDPTP